ncbi:MAG: SF1B family DNA helicase RecD2 [Anaerolineales bacterium]
MDILEGVVERITFYNPENGYSVLRLAPATARRALNPNDELITVVGNLPEVQPGEHLKLTGAWANHTDYGRQFRAEHCEQTLPASVDGIRRYLGSGLIKGIGPRTAEKIVEAFGAETLYVIDSQPQRLREVPAIGEKRYEWITTAWETQKAIKEVMVFLQSHGVRTGLAVKTFKQYGDESLTVVQTEPYRLARDIWGVGFKTADKLAQALGLPVDSPARIEAGLVHTLNELADDGHVYAPQPELTRVASELLAVPSELIAPALERLQHSGQIVRETLPGDAHPAVYLTPFHRAEVNAAARLRTLIGTRDMFGQTASRLSDFAGANWESLFVTLDTTPPRAAAHSAAQRSAVQMALTHKVCVLTGGPGTGKTTTLRALIHLAERAGHTIALASPTGRAAKRLSEATGRPAQTLHRLLGFSPLQGGFTQNEHNRLPAHLVVVDEVSMLDLVLFNTLLKAVDPRAHLLLVGDADQLPSVGAGDVLRDLITSAQIPIIRLSHIFRQAADSDIIRNAHRIHAGHIPVFARESRDCYLFVEDEPEAAAERVVDVVANRIPHKFGLNPLTEVQVLAPMRRGAAGVIALNARLQTALNPPAPNKAERQIGGRALRVGDRLLQVRNDYQKEVFNGDIGWLSDLDAESQTLMVNFDGRPVLYDWADADELQHAFAVSIHKAQGSEFPAVVIPLLTQHYVMLQRNLLYTALTRARQLCVLVGSRKAIAIAVRNATVQPRWSGLARRLAE